MKRHRVVRVAAFVFLTLTLAIPSWAQSAESIQHPFAGERVRFVVGYGAGGGYDAYARLLAPHLERETGATVIVENWTGGGGLVALNRLSADRSDRLTLTLINAPSAILSQILGMEGVRYDLRDLVWLGRVLADSSVILVSPVSPYRSLADLVNADRTLRWASPGVTANAGIAALISQALDIKSKIIVGYKGTAESSLAALRGEADLVAMSETSASQQIHNNGLIPIAVVSTERSTLLPDVPTVVEQYDLSPGQAWWIDYSVGVMETGRALATSSRIPQEHAEYLRRVVEKILTDPDVRREAAARGRAIEFAPSNVLQMRVERALDNLEEDIRNELKHVIVEKFLP